MSKKEKVIEKMGYSIELYFESQFEEKLRSVWDELEKAGIGFHIVPYPKSYPLLKL